MSDKNKLGPNVNKNTLPPRPDIVKAGSACINGVDAGHIYMPMNFYSWNVKKDVITKDGHTMFKSDIARDLNDFRRGYLRAVRLVENLNGEISQLEKLKKEDFHILQLCVAAAKTHKDKNETLETELQEFKDFSHEQTERISELLKENDSLKKETGKS